METIKQLIHLHKEITVIAKDLLLNYVKVHRSKCGLTPETIEQLDSAALFTLLEHLYIKDTPQTKQILLKRKVLTVFGEDNAKVVDRDGISEYIKEEEGHGVDEWPCSTFMEKLAYIQGIEDMCGWMDYYVLDPTEENEYEMAKKRQKKK